MNRYLTTYATLRLYRAVCRGSKRDILAALKFQRRVMR